ncbi:hypothetical protein HPP92_011963 [Vanilla planifolia]|uniref:BTB/POZ domain-containing protein n=1 Tax=Vanilla planifolia TaxID=51239 RepID=A0A835V2A9_VANPL|nr:hypothetical protein HPP92_011963 [Vanilla planifolia]
MAATYCGSSAMSDSKVEIIARLAQWRIENFGPCSTRRSDAFKIGIWNWYLSVEKNRYLYIRLYPEPCKTVKDLPPFAKFVLRVSSSGPGRRHCISAVQERMIRNSEDFVWAVEATFPGRFVIDVEFLDLKIPCSSGSEHYSVFPNGEAVLQAANDGGLSCLSRMLEEEIHSDVTINTNGGGALKSPQGCSLCLLTCF